jgi:hypothetical protein
MNKKQLLDHCRYYKGKPNYTGSAHEYYYWQAEEHYVLGYGSKKTARTYQQIQEQVSSNKHRYSFTSVS